uniref:WecB/TagA/CpsF family glycosyltransferase n=1 Tax=Ningiella ruwaisensis TaxID=2364274 RepID=UPI00109F800F|nr:WecB/TagA/CpsF family glycosyltransferase [Ningiella ruwaisensis]
MRIEDVVFTNVGGLKTACITRKELVELMAQRVTDFRDPSSDYFEKPMTIYSTNGHSISIANSDRGMRNILNQADILHADGQSVVFFSKHFSKHQIPERSATTDTIHDFPKMVHGTYKHYLLGATETVIKKASNKMGEQYSNFAVSGYRDGYFDETQVTEVIKEINQSGADVLWVGLGKPKEQEFIHHYKSSLKVPVIISCGGCYNFITGDYSRAPEWMQKYGLEWLHRAATQPRKLLWRYLTTNPHSIYCAAKHHYFSKG